MIKRFSLLAIFLLFLFACSEDSSSPTNIDVSEVPSSSSVIESAPSSSSSAGKPASSSSSIRTEIVYDTVIKDVDTIPYFYPDTLAFDWNAEPISSSSSSVDVLQSSSSAIPAVISGDSLVDGRDNEVYRLVMVENLVWMSENLRYASANSVCYGDEEDCSKGRLYTYAALSSACPAGWRLPTRAEYTAAVESSSYPWSYEGRMKVSGSENTYAYYSQMGFFWLDTSEKPNTKTDTLNCSSNACGMIFVKKSPSYGDGVHLFQEDDQKKGFSVRCVTKLK